MKIYRKLSQIKILSFDLDDTLYDNKPIIKSAIAAQFDYIKKIKIWGNKWVEQGPDFWHKCRTTVQKEVPGIEQNVTLLRQTALKYGFKYIGLNEQDSQMHAHKAYKAFIDTRSQIIVKPEVLTLLKKLSKKYTLIAITNGNVDISQFSLKNSFEFLLMAGFDGPQKPAPNMFELAANKLNVSLSNILHIGDNLDSDIQGANNIGCMSCWLNEEPIKTQYKGLADIEISNILQLEKLL
ncbi:HAD-IA family hydrolase [Pseudoalteromonas denitrificans]|jgi:putative hydrolase of the HAD superfamily|uniref:Putative hydrolase of the HAD superfamily n=1 Tax=Pseudoalteromonas denitrificans DSM 6059 TaxID=1123010 RepID=A0A1I1SNB6_9GAMM|nr:HAD-IA family hydrolase [Pseudoalteromonas denitrificans]SFD45373.1 putative hydrolase of the HAD superfamily [Pseudoalteromonas denitrificans DSM 6059]